MRTALTALVVVTAAALLAAPALAGPRDFRVGVVDSHLGAVDVGGMGKANVEPYRVNFSWVQIESGKPRPGSRCRGTGPMPGTNYRDGWDPYDRLVRQASARGVPLLPVIVGSPAYVARSSSHAPNTGVRREAEAYKCFVRAVVDRYGTGGDLPRLLGVKPIKDWQIWNEPNLPKYATEERGPNPREYAELVKLTSNQIRAEDRSATIALAGLPFTNAGPTPEDFLRKVYRARGIERKFDAIAVHPYAADYRGVKGAILRLRDMLKDVRDRGRAIWVTETGWATAGRNYDFVVKSRRGQAEQLEKTFKMLKKNRREWNIGTVTWFRWRDQAAPSQNRGAFEYMGLYTHGGRPKPSCRRFVGFTNGGRCAAMRNVSGASASTAASLGDGGAITASPKEE